MAEIPDEDELLEAVRGFIEDARGVLEGHRAFHACIAANVVEIVRRELTLGSGARAAETRRLVALLGRSGDRDTLNRALCQSIRAGRMAIDDPGLLEHLERTTLDRLAIDQPDYSGVRIAREGV